MTGLVSTPLGLGNAHLYLPNDYRASYPRAPTGILFYFQLRGPRSVWWTEHAHDIIRDQFGACVPSSADINGTNLFLTKLRKVPRISPDEFMSPNASTPPNKQSLDYIVRSGIAGGVAGCVVRNSRPQCPVFTMCLVH